MAWLVYPVRGQSEQEIRFSSGRSSLAGTITRPTGTGLHLAVVIILGSGSQNRDGEINGLHPFRAVALALAKKGFVVLRYDNRSKGHSTGKAIEQSTTLELATDAQAAFRYLSQQSGVDPNQVGLIGHSEGSLIATIAASHLSKAKFLFIVNGTTLTGLDDLLLTTQQRLRKAGLSTDEIQDTYKT